MPVWFGVDYGASGEGTTVLLLRYSDGKVVPFQWLPEEDEEPVVHPDVVYGAQRALIVSTRDRGVRHPRKEW